MECQNKFNFRKLFSGNYHASLSGFAVGIAIYSKADCPDIDVGCGAGFPGLPLKIALPTLELYLLETNRKKVSFLKHIIRLLNLSTAFVLHDRVENIIKTDTWKEKFDILISRAAFKLSELLPQGEYFLGPRRQTHCLERPQC